MCVWPRGAGRMARLLHFDPFCGASGDMIVACLLELGAPLEHLRAELAKVGFGGYSLSSGVVKRAGIVARRFEVHLEGEVNRHEHEHHQAPPEGGAHRHRSLREIRALVAESGLSETVRARTLQVFERLAQAEGKIHGTASEAVRFHEVGATDSLVDFLGTFIALEALEVERVSCAVPAVGGGTVTCAHGVLPLPAPATLELLAGREVRPSGLEGELLTPTGAALLTSLTARFEPLPEMRVLKTAYGAGSRDIAGVPNVLRAVLGETVAETAPPPFPFGAQREEIVELCATIDDATGETLGYALGRLMAAGALDVTATPVTMKKNRPGVVLSVLCEPPRTAEMLRQLFGETTTFGVRFRSWERAVLPREQAVVTTRYGPVRVKLARHEGRVVACAPEFEDCRQAAESTGAPLRAVYAAALAAADGLAAEENGA